MRLLLCLSASQQHTSVCTIKILLDLDWFHLYLPRARENTQEFLFLSSVDPVPLVRTVSRHWHLSKKELTWGINLLAIQLAKLSGFSPIITTASLKHADYLKSIGATHVIDRSVSAPNLVSEISGITKNGPIKYALDPISLPDTQQTSYDILGKGGKLAIFLPPAAKTTQEKEIYHIYALLRDPSNIELLESLLHDNLERLLKEGAITVSRSGKIYFVYLLTDGELQPNQVEVLPNGLAGIQEGLNRLEANQVSRLKLVVHPQETA